MPAKLREPEPPREPPLDIVKMNDEIYEFVAEAASAMSPVNDQIVLRNLRTGYKTSFPATDVRAKAKPIAVANGRPVDAPISVECLVAESRALRERLATEPIAA